MAKSRMTEIGGSAPTNGAARSIAARVPYTAAVTIKGVSDIIFHAWNCEDVSGTADGPDNSTKSSKTDNLPVYVYRDDKGELGVPGVNICAAIAMAAKFRKDPRSPRKSAFDLFKAAVVPQTAVASLGVREWDYEHRARVRIKMAAITRVRPAMRAGWEVSFELAVVLPEYIDPSLLHSVISDAGRLVGLCDFRPTYGRFQVTRFETDRVKAAA